MYLNAMTFYHLGRHLKDRRVPFLPRMMELCTFLGFNCSIPLSASIGKDTRCDHRGIGVVIHEDSVIGERCRLFPHVVIGSLGSSRKGAPVIGNDVTIWVGASVIGPVHVGDGAIIGAHALVLSDVAAHSTVVGVPARPIRRGGQTKGRGLQGLEQAAPWSYPERLSVLAEEIRRHAETSRSDETSAGVE